MLEAIISLIGGGIFGKLQQLLRNKTYIETPPQNISNDQETPQEMPELMESNSTIGRLGNFIVITTKSFITMWIFVLLFYLIYLDLNHKLDETLAYLFNTIITYILPSVIGYWFIRIDGISTIKNTLIKYIKR